MKNKHQYYYDNDHVDLPGGLYAVVKTEQDEVMGPPWEEHDGHGPVSDWVQRDKAPGERILSSDHGSKRYYDFAGAVVIAKRDGWGLGPDELAALERKLGRKPTAKQVAVAAVERDYEHLRGWCNDEWHWIGVIVTLYGPDDKEIESDSLWGIEDDTDYWKSVASDMTETLFERYEKEKQEVQHWAERDVLTVQ